MLMQMATKPRVDGRSVLKAIFHFLLARLGVRCLRGDSFFGTLVPQPAVVADFGAGERAVRSLRGILLERSSAKETTVKPVIFALAGDKPYFPRLIDRCHSAKQDIPELSRRF